MRYIHIMPGGTRFYFQMKQVEGAWQIKLDNGTQPAVVYPWGEKKWFIDGALCGWISPIMKGC